MVKTVIILVHQNLGVWHVFNYDNSKEGTLEGKYAFGTFEAGALTLGRGGGRILKHIVPLIMPQYDRLCPEIAQNSQQF